jgi:hypothetical protein
LFRASVGDNLHYPILEIYKYLNYTYTTGSSYLFYFHYFLYVL